MIVPTRIAIAVDSVRHDGGVEKMTQLLANALAARGHEVAVITRAASTPDHMLARGISLMQMYQPRGPKRLRKIQLPLVIGSLRKHLQRFDAQVVIGSRWDAAILSLLATVRTPIGGIVWEHRTLPGPSISRPWRVLRRFAYRRAAAAVLVNNASIAFAEHLVDRSRIHVIPNFLDADRPASPASASRWEDFPGGPPDHRLIALGRLEHEKGFDRLIEAFALIAADLPDWGVLILGRGAEQAHLDDLIRTSGMASRVWLAGAVDDPRATVAASDAFVLPSRYEGFPLGLIESMAAGLPVVAFACPAGPGEIIRDGIDGLLVPEGDIVALANALRSVMSDIALRERLGKDASKIRERLAPERVLPSWIDVIRTTTETVR